MNYNSLDDFKNRTQNGEKEEDFGGLSVFLDLKRVGFVLQPDELGCDSQKCSQTVGEEPLNPAEIMVGCHKTMENQTNRDFSSGSFDEIAIWKYWLNDTLLPYFLGGYSKYYLHIPAILLTLASHKSPKVLNWLAKGQLISECLLDLFKFSKKPTKNLTSFCPRI